MSSEPCSCLLAGLCERHGVVKPPLWHRLCQHREEYREAWDAGYGPGQSKPEPQAEPIKTREPREKRKPCTGNRKGQTAAKMPSVLTQAWNLASSLASFVADGCKLVDAAEYSRRLHICDQCELRSGTRCTRCGCNLAFKARGLAFRCPDGRWESDGAASSDSTPPGTTSAAGP